MSDWKQYYRLVYDDVRTFTCQECDFDTTPRGYVAHVREVHGVPKLTCPWCEKVTSPDRMDYRHLIDCFVSLKTYNTISK